MQYFETWGESGHFIPLTICLIMLLLMALYILIYFRKRKLPLVNGWFVRPRRRGLFTACCGTFGADSANAILNERYAKGEITKEQYDDIKKDISVLENSQC